MRILVAWTGGLVCAGALASAAHAWYPPPHPPAPDACGPGFYASNMYGGVYGPVYYLRPPSPPPIMPPCDTGGRCGQAGGPAGPPAYPTHPYARSPRDFFMVDDP